MVATAPCPDWEYRNHPDCASELPPRAAAVALEVRSRVQQVETAGCDTRGTHLRLFSGLTPLGFDHYAGHYRGESFPCLDALDVGVGVDRLVGYPVATVGPAMLGFQEHILRAAVGLDEVFGSSLSPDLKLARAIKTAAAVFVEFLTIHPYANGNGHIARFLVWLLLGRFGYWPERWTIDPTPTLNRQAYYEGIADLRRGDPTTLEQLIRDCLSP